MGRREFFIAGFVLLASPHVGRAQQSGRTYVVGALFPGGSEDSYRPVLRERLATHGFVEGHNLRIEQRTLTSFDGGFSTTRELAALKVDAILSSSTNVTLGVKAATNLIPVIFHWVHDPVGVGLVADLARPGGNVTGIANREDELMQKRFELALEIAPGAKRVAVFAPVGNETWYSVGIQPKLLEAAQRASVNVLELRTLSGASAVDDAYKAGARAILMPANLVRAGYRSVVEALIRRCLEHRLPLIAVGREEAEAGALISYNADENATLELAADMLARVLKSARPGDIPVNQASSFELVVNLKTAKALGITIPGSILLRADRVIE